MGNAKRRGSLTERKASPNGKDNTTRRRSQELRDMTKVALELFHQKIRKLHGKE